MATKTVESLPSEAVQAVLEHAEAASLLGSTLAHTIGYTIPDSIRERAREAHQILVDSARQNTNNQQTNN